MRFNIAITDIRHRLPRRGTWMRRPLSAIKTIAIHWDAEFRPNSYGSLSRYIRQAWFHINKNWGGGARGDGLMYHFKIDNVGEIFWCRDLEDVTWHVGNANYRSIGVCFDGGPGQQPTPQQRTAFQRLMDELCYHHPEFPAGKKDIRGHKELMATACPGSFMPLVIAYRGAI